ncbi:MAG: PP2C family protein-serine/threonine phosphatase [Candidatus Kapaibacterium sp.]
MATQSLINLESLIALSARLNEADSEDFILNSAMLSIMGKLRVSRACILKPINGRYEIALTKGRQALKSLDYFDIDSFTELSHDSVNYNDLYEAGFRYCLPVQQNKENLAVICLGPIIDETAIGQEEAHYARLVSSITANALQNFRNRISLIKAKNELETRNQLLTTLYELSRDFSTILSREEILQLLSFNLMGQLMVSRFAIVMLDNGKPAVIVNRFGSSISDQALELLKDINCLTDLSDDELLVSQLLRNDNVDARMISPMELKGEKMGYLILGGKLSGTAFTPDDKLFIESLGNTAMPALENVRLFAQEVEKKRLENELDYALEIQINLLPKQLPEVPGLDIFGISIPSSHVGGDYYDFILTPNGRLLIAIADVSGKGMPASLLMANFQAALRVLAQSDISLKEMIIKLNRLIFENTSADKFITCFCAVYDYSNKILRYINAGHNPPYYINASGDIMLLDKGGLILGIMEDSHDYEEDSVRLDSGMIALFTDGITEAQNPENEEFGEQRLKELLLSTEGSAKEISHELIRSVKKFNSGKGQYDDLTVAILKAL